MKIIMGIRSIVDWLRVLLGLGQDPPRQLAAQSLTTRSDTDPAVASPVRPAPPDPRAQAEAYLAKVQIKLVKLAQDFNNGTINRSQFQNLYVHYQREIRNITGLIELAPASPGWAGAMTEGQSLLIRRRHLARAQGYAIYENESGMPISTLGEFEFDPALLVPMLSSYRAATKEIFGAGMRSTAIEGGRWLCFVPGEFTTMLAVFSTEPADKQLEFLDELHRLFEQANHRRLANPPLDGAKLLFPHEYYLGEWRR